jgi:hypothetical protein
MNLIRQRMVSLKNRARHLQTSLCQWSLYDDSVSREMKDDLLARYTPGEESAFASDRESIKSRLRPVSAQIRTLSRWYEYVLEQINEELDRARTVLDQGRHGESLAILNDVEIRMIVPNEETLGYVFRTLGQHTSPELHQKLGTIDAIIRDLGSSADSYPRRASPARPWRMSRMCRRWPPPGGPMPAAPCTWAGAFRSPS